MLELINLSHHVQRRGTEPLTVLDHVSMTAPGGHLLAVLGAACSGKTTLIHTLAGLRRVQSGEVVWHGRETTKQPFHPNEIGYVSGDDSSLHDLLSVKENIVGALLLRVGGISKRDALVRADKLMLFCGLDNLAGQRASTLTAPMRRRLSLAMALAPDPLLILCDDFTDGIDPKAERELAALLQLAAKENPRRLVINATQNLAKLSVYDSVVVLHEGRVCFHGPGRALTHYFSVPQIEDLYQRLAKRPSQRWQDSWNRHRDSYYAAFKLFSGGGGAETDLGTAGDDDDSPRPAKNGGRVSLKANVAVPEEKKQDMLPPPPARPPFGTQLQVLLQRRWIMFRRSKSQMWQHIILLLGLPLTVAMLAWPEMEALRSVLKSGAAASSESLMHAGHFASLLLLLQILGLIFMATRNGSREIAGERNIWQREHLGGLRSSAYLASKVAFVGLLVLAQSLWMGLCIDLISGGLPGNGAMRLALMILTSAAFTALSLGISAFSRSGDQAASRVWMLAFLQAPLSGALIALPGWLSAVLHPLVTAFYGWSGSVETLKGSAIYEPLTKLNATWFASPTTAIVLLVLHLIVGLILASTGLRRAGRS
ncbi:MAG: ABC-type multidrug transport system, ATPase component [Verrucomicrobiaceae bacterium]|nr:ABC-type multidrug transport system, ATPase component [Verrucomicrobiaceae bacterium]